MADGEHSAAPTDDHDPALATIPHVEWQICASIASTDGYDNEYEAVTHKPLGWPGHLLTQRHLTMSHPSDPSINSVECHCDLSVDTLEQHAVKWSEERGVWVAGWPTVVKRCQHAHGLPNTAWVLVARPTHRHPVAIGGEASSSCVSILRELERAAPTLRHATAATAS